MYHLYFDKINFLSKLCLEIKVAEVEIPTYKAFLVQLREPNYKNNQRFHQLDKMTKYIVV